MYKIGFSRDLHLITKRSSVLDNYFKLGLVKIKEHPYVIKANSDGDVLVHAVTEAILGALNEGSLGEHFDHLLTDENKDEFAQYMLNYVRNLLKKHRFKIINIDCLITYDLLKLTPFRLLMQKNMASQLKINSQLVSVKFTTSETIFAKLNANNSNSYIEAFANVLLNKF